MKMSNFVASNLAFAPLFLLLSSCDRKPDAPRRDIPWNKAITYGSLTDVRDNQVYKTVRIGRQTWMAQNLNYAGNDSRKVGLWFNGNPDSGAKYGRLYTWSEAMALDVSNAKTTWGGSDSAHQGICPAGWRIPSDPDWIRLTDSTMGASRSGKDLKAVAGWFPSGVGSGNGTDLLGFRALPGGNHSAAFDVLGENAAFWSSTEGFSEYAWFRIIYNGSDLVHRFSSSKTYGFSLRCIQD